MENKKFFDHFKELNYRIYTSLMVITIFFIITYFNYSTIYEILINPLLKAGYSTTDLVAFTIYEGFQVKILNTFFVSLTLAMPFIIFILGYFFKPALENTSHIIFLSYLLIFISLFYLGIFSAYKSIPVGINFLLEFNESEFILRTQNYFQLISRISILFGLSFQMPLVIFFLIKKNIIKRTLLTNNRKEIFVFVLIFSAVITPTGDPITLFIFTIPLYLLIELVLYLSKK
jgi:sec-independent protein translocase protein TatC|tara:strand:+ start:3068 stop:3760 length:693 start_codon:yes stop_codon:yes gene_type:complete